MKILSENRLQDIYNLGMKDGNRVSDVIELKVKYDLSSKHGVKPGEVEDLFEDEYYEMMMVFEKKYLEGFEKMMPHPFLDI